MKRMSLFFFLGLMLILFLYGIALSAERPVVNVPLAWRQQNWEGSEGMGSCVHASIITLFRWQGRFKTAEYWKQHYENGEWPEDMAAKLNKEGIKWAATTSGDVKFLEWACRTRRGCGVTVMGGAHMVTLVHLDSKWAALLDNNNVSKFSWIPRDTFIAEWKASSGWALMSVYSPPAPLPVPKKSPK